MEYEKAVEGSQDMIAVVDREYRYLIANQAYLSHRGMERGEVVGHLISDMVGQEAFEQVVKGKFDEYFQGKVGRYEFKQKYPTLGERDLSVTYFPIEGTAGIDRAACVMRDITDRKRAEEALRESEERFRLFMNNSPTVASMKDKQGRYIYMSETYLKHFGIRLEDRQGKTDLEVYPRAIAEQFRMNDQAALDAGHPIEVIEESLSPDGKGCYWLAYKFPFQDASGQVFVAGIGMDITERNKMERDLQVSLEQLRALAARLQSIGEEERKRVAREAQRLSG